MSVQDKDNCLADTLDAYLGRIDSYHPKDLKPSVPPLSSKTQAILHSLELEGIKPSQELLADIYDCDTGKITIDDLISKTLKRVKG